jgi:hypothetical protein
MVTYIEIEFPEEPGEESQYPWGIAWMSSQTTEGYALAFISTLPNGWIPENSADFMRQFLDAVQQRWKEICSRASRKVEHLVSDHNNFSKMQSLMRPYFTAW